MNRCPRCIRGTLIHEADQGIVCLACGHIVFDPSTPKGIAELEEAIALPQLRRRGPAHAGKNL